jgi:hypothetical protein
MQPRSSARTPRLCFQLCPSGRLSKCSVVTAHRSILPRPPGLECRSPTSAQRRLPPPWLRTRRAPAPGWDRGSPQTLYRLLGFRLRLLRVLKIPQANEPITEFPPDRSCRAVVARGHLILRAPAELMIFYIHGSHKDDKDKQPQPTAGNMDFIGLS